MGVRKGNTTMEYPPATPVVALVEPCERDAHATLLTLDAAGYAARWYRAAADLLAEAMASAPDVVILAGTQPARFDQWHAARALRALDAAVIMATADAAARREVHTTPRGAAFVDSVRAPCDPAEALAAVRRAIRDYPANLRAAERTRHAAQRQWRDAVGHLSAPVPTTAPELPRR